MNIVLILKVLLDPEMDELIPTNQPIWPDLSTVFTSLVNQSFYITKFSFFADFLGTLALEQCNPPEF